jgi:hypothetical protein
MKISLRDYFISERIFVDFDEWEENVVEKFGLSILQNFEKFEIMKNFKN